MGRGTEESPYTRKDILRRIRKNGGTANGLDLSGKTFADGVDLSGLDLKGINLKNARCFSLPWLRAMIGTYLEEDVRRDTNPKEVLSSGAHFENTRLSYAHLEGAELPFSHFERSDLSRAHLEGANLAFAFIQGASLIDAHLEGTRLTRAFLEGTALGLAHLEGASLGGAKFSEDTKLEGVDWGNYILGEEKNGAFPLAAETYRRLKQWYTNAGMYDTAGEFFFREMTAKRKNLWWGDVPKRLQEAVALLRLEQAFEQNANGIHENIDEMDSHLFEKLSKFPFVLFPKKPLSWAWSKFLSLICGYGEKPLRVIGWAASVVLGLAFVYLAIGSLWGWNFWDSLYFSVVSFTALGYGSWLNLSSGVASDWIRGLGAFESFIGVFSIALFLVTFIRKMTR